MYQKDTLNILEVLPGGGPSKELDEVKGACTSYSTQYNSEFTGSSGGNISPAIKQHKKTNKLQNVLLTQTMALSFNVRWDTAMLNLLISGDTLHTYSSLDCDSNKNVANGNYQKIVLNSSIRAYFGGSYTIGDLLDLANAALSGRYVPTGGNPSLNAISDAVADINEGFDECRLLVDQTKSSSSSLKTGTVAGDNQAPVGGYEQVVGADNMAVEAYPNPFKDELMLNVATYEAGQATITIIDGLGQVVDQATVDVSAGYNEFSIATHDLPAGVYVINVVLNGELVRVKLIKTE
jgi:hypothetical protein